MFQGLPRWLTAFGIVVVVVIEIVARLPDIMLFPQRLAGTAGEYGGKAQQAELVATQIAKTEADTKLANTQAQLNAEQAAKAAAETRVAQLQAEVTAAQAAKTRAETELAQAQAVAAAAQAQKARVETMVAQQQVAATAAQADKAAADARLAQAQTTKTTLDNAFTLWTINQLGIARPSVPSQASANATASDPSPRATSAAFETGRSDWHRWHDWTAGLTGDRLAGQKFWAATRSQKPAKGCAAAPSPRSAEFMDGCESAKGYLVAVDEQRQSNSDYRAGWNQGAKETGGY